MFQILGHDLADQMTPLAAPDADRLSIELWLEPRALLRWPPEFALRENGLRFFASQFTARAA